VRVVVVRRPVDEVVASFLRLPLGYQEATLRPLMERTAAKLDQIERRWPGVLAVTFDDLTTEDGCRRVWEHVLPYPHQPDWWAAVSLVNIQVDMRVLVRRFRAYQPQLEKLAKIAKHRIVSDMRPAEREFDGMTFQTQPFSEFVRDARGLIIDHCALVGRKAELDFNVPLLEAMDQIGALQVMTARSNGRCFGYLVSIVEPSLDGPEIIQGHHTMFYTAPEVRGLGVRLLMRANDALRERGVSQIWMRAGVVGSGPRMGAVYRRLGAQPWGELYRMEL
jgi:GNAT superfamily N-acetyltransferase